MNSPMPRFHHRIEKLVDHIFLITGHSFSLLIVILLSISWLISQSIHSLNGVVQATITVAPFILLFIIQKWQNKFALSIQLKLNELIATQENASNRLISVEKLSEEDLRKLAELYIKMQTLHGDEKLNPSHSVEIEIEKNRKDDGIANT